MLPVSYFFGLLMRDYRTLAISSFRSLMPLGMVNIKIKSRLVAEPLSTLLYKVVILRHGTLHNQWGRGRKPHKLLI